MDTTTPEGLGWEHGAFAAEHATLDETPETLSDDEVAAYFPTADRTATLIAYRNAWSESFQTFAEAEHDDPQRCRECNDWHGGRDDECPARFCASCGADVIGNDPHEPGCEEEPVGFTADDLATDDEPCSCGTSHTRAEHGYDPDVDDAPDPDDAR